MPLAKVLGNHTTILQLVTIHRMAINSHRPSQLFAIIGVVLALLAFTAQAEAAPLTWGRKRRRRQRQLGYFDGQLVQRIVQRRLARGRRRDLRRGQRRHGDNASNYDIVVSSMTFNTPGYVIQDEWMYSWHERPDGDNECGCNHHFDSQVDGI